MVNVLLKVSILFSMLDLAIDFFHIFFENWPKMYTAEPRR